MIRHLRLDSPRPVVFSDDPALDKGAKDFEAAWQEYQRTYDVSKLPVVAGGTLTVFAVSSLTEAQIAHIETALMTSNFGGKEMETIALGVHDIIPYEVVDSAGKVTTKTIERVAAGKLGQRLPADVMTLFADDKLRREIYAQVCLANGVHKEHQKSD